MAHTFQEVEMGKFPITIHTTDQDLMDAEFLGADTGLSPEEVAYMAFRVGLRGMLGLQDIPMNDYGEGAVEVKDFQESLPSMIRQMRENLSRDLHIGQIGYTKYILYSTFKDTYLLKSLVGRWAYKA